MNIQSFRKSWTILPVAIALISFSIAASADDIVTLSGKHYRDVKVSRIEPDGITIVTHNGVKKIPFSMLPQEEKEKYGYNAGKETAYMAAVQHDNEARARQQAAQMAAQQLIKGTVFKNTTEGVLLRYKADSGMTVHESQWHGDKHISGDVPRLVDAFYLIKQHPNADVLEPGSYIAIIAIPGGSEVVEGTQADVYTFVRDTTPVK